MKSWWTREQMSTTGRDSEGNGANTFEPGLAAWPLPGLAIAAVELVLALLAGVLAASLMWVLLFGSYQTPLPAGQAFDDRRAASAGNRPVSGSPARLFGQRASAPDVRVETLPESRLGFALFGVRTSTQPEAGSAIIEVGAGGQRSFAAGTEIQPGVTLAEVYEDRVVLDRRGAREVIYLTERARARQRADNGPLAPAVIAGVSLTPRPLASGGEGLQVETASGPLSALGIRPGDIIASIDGQPLSGGLIRSLADSIEQGDLPASLTLERDGERLTLQTRQNP